MFTGGISIASGGAAADQTLRWDGGGLPAGQQILRLEGRNAAGNTAQVERGVQIVAPTATPLPPPTKPPAPKATTAPLAAAGASAESSPTPTAIIGEMDTSAEPGGGSEILPLTPTRAAVMVPFGGPPWSPAESGGADHGSGELGGYSGRGESAATGGSGSGILWGAAAVALMGGVTAYALQQRRRREEAARHLAGEMARRNALAEARDRARAAAEAAARWARDTALAAAAAAAEAARQARERFYQWRLTRKQAMLEQPVPSPPRDPALDLAAWKQGDMAQMGHAMEVARSLPKAQEEKRWWERALDWADRSQVGVAVGMGVLIGLGALAVIATGGVALPIVLGGAAALTALTVGGGTIALNAHNGRTWHDGLARNLSYAVVSGAITVGAGLIITSGTGTAAVLRAGSAVSSFCISHPTACARLEPALVAIDRIEEAGLMVKGTIQIWRGDTQGAADTALELQLEHLDGGFPGNSAAVELQEVLTRHGDEAVDLVAHYGDDAAALLARHGEEGLVLLRAHGEEGLRLWQKHGDEAIGALQGQVVRVGADQVEDLARDLEQITGARTWFSPASGRVYVSTASEEAKEAVMELKNAVASGDDAQVKILIDQIAAVSTRGSGKRVVLGHWVEGGGYIQAALDEGGMFFDTSDEVWELLKKSGVDPWKVNDAFVRQYVVDGGQFEYSLRDLADRETEIAALRALLAGNEEEALKLIGKDSLPYRLREAKVLLGEGYFFKVDIPAELIRLSRP